MVFGLFSRLKQLSPLVNDGGNDNDNDLTTSVPPPTPLPVDTTQLHNLILSVPPQTLHDYTLAHLSPSATLPPSHTTLASLTSFFSTLAPPPRLHCVRCHKFFFEIENDDRSCLIPHDDESAFVERLGWAGGKGNAKYETLWGCCGKTVEGDGDMGPPDGWCYEGKHTTDAKRARFRADSTPHDDKLVPCEWLRCHRTTSPSSLVSESVAGERPRGRRKRARGLPPASCREGSDESERVPPSTRAEESGEEGKLGVPKGRVAVAVKKRSRARARKVSVGEKEDAMDVDGDSARGEKPRSKSGSRLKPESKTSHTEPKPKSLSRSMKSRAGGIQPSSTLAKHQKGYDQMCDDVNELCNLGSGGEEEGGETVKTKKRKLV